MKRPTQEYHVMSEFLFSNFILGHSECGQNEVPLVGLCTYWSNVISAVFSIYFDAFEQANQYFNSSLSTSVDWNTSASCQILHTLELFLAARVIHCVGL